ncbi:tyrosine-type recombinase/integrase [Pseudomonas sp. Rh2]|uniref:tyrosine-type recombinase/integrase n=1 Tax=Pseudomonas sp. Rh2 TaxID=3112956 RepID=UPI00345DCED9
MLVNFFYTTSIHLGKRYHVLRSSDQDNFGKEFTPLSIHLRDLIESGSHQQSVRKSGPCVANFIDYFHIASKYITPTKTAINTVFREYHSYLTAGEDSFSETVRKVCETKPSPKVENSSSFNYHMQIIPFLKDLKNIQQTYEEYIENGLTADQPETSQLIDSLMKITPSMSKVSKYEKAAMKHHITPMTAGSCKKQRRASYTGHIPYEESFAKTLEEHQFFPLDRITDLINNASSFRNACLYALIAATNARDSEADQILWEDINFSTREVLLRNPNTRSHPSEAYRGISEIDRNRLEWKGRGTELTVLLEPYGTLFFKKLEDYLRYEYNPSCGHNFVFHDKHGKPLFLCDYSTVILHQFKQAAAKALPDQPHLARRLGLHSLRHSNIYFFKNYLEHSQGQGLNDSELILLTGHSDIRSLQKYAKADRELLLEKISLANHMRKHGSIKSSIEYQVKYLEERLEIFKNKLKAQRETEASI